MTYFSFYDHDATQSECTHCLAIKHEFTLQSVNCVASINEHLRKFSLRKSTDEKIVVSGRV